MKRIIILSLFFLLLVPHTVMAIDIHQKIEITINPKEGNYTKMFNIVNENNSWLDNRHIWEGFRTDGRIVGEGIIPNPIRINDFENDSGTAKMSVISMKYLDSYDIMSGASESWIRLPIGINETSYSSSIVLDIKLYAIEGDNYNITSFNYTDVKYTTYASHYLLYEEHGEIKDLKTVENQSYSYPHNLTDLSLRLQYIHVRGPIIAHATYILFEYVEIPDFQNNSYPFYVLGSYTNDTGYYYVGSEKTLPTHPSWSMLVQTGMSEDVYSFNISPENEYFSSNASYFCNKDIDYILHPGDNWNVTVVFPVYSTTTVTLMTRIWIAVHYIYNSHKYYGYWNYTKNETLKEGINNIFINATLNVTAANWLSPDDNNYYADTLTIQFYSSSGSHIYFYGVRDTTTSITTEKKNVDYFFGNYQDFYRKTSLLYYFFFSPNSKMVMQTFYFQGIQEPIIIYKTKYVYSLLDFPIMLYKYDTMIWTNLVYFFTFGHVDLRYLYSNDFILKMAQAAKEGLESFIDMVRNSPIGLFIKMIIDFLVNSAAWWGNWLLQFGLFFLNVAAYAIFLWPWIVLARGLVAYQEQGVDAMLDYFSSYVDRVTSLMSKLMSKIPTGVG